GIDFSTQDLFGALYRQRRDLAAQFRTRAVGHILDVGLGRGLLACRFGERIDARLVDDLPGLLVGALDDDRRFRARLLHLVIGARVGFGQFLARTVGGFEAFGDAL